MTSKPTWFDIVGLASIGCGAYGGFESRLPGYPEPDEHSIESDARQAWGHLFLPIWAALDDKGRESVRCELDYEADEFERALRDAERRMMMAVEVR